MGYFAVVLARHEGGWDANDIELEDIEDLDELADQMRESSSVADSDATFLLVLEQEDTWFALVRVDGAEDPRVFVSDATAVEPSTYAEILLEATGFGEGESEEDGEAEDTADLGGEPIGDQDILADLGTDGATLIALCTKEGIMPSEILDGLLDTAGAGDVLEALR